MNYKKPVFWVILASVVVCAAVAVCFLTNPKSKGSNAGNREAMRAKMWFDYLEKPDELDWNVQLEIELPEYPGVTFRWHPGMVEAVVEAVTENEITLLYTGMPIWSTYFCDLTGDGLPELCSTFSVGSGMVDNRIIVCDYANGASYTLEDRGEYDYSLRLDKKDGCLWVDKKVYNRDDIVASGKPFLTDNGLQVAYEN